MQYRIMSINDLLFKLNLRNSYNQAIIFVTTKPNYYDFGLTPFLKLEFADDDKNVVTRDIIRELDRFIKSAKNASMLYVCCDAGLSRSPAVAAYIQWRLGQIDSFHHIEYEYKFLNKNILVKLIQMAQAYDVGF